MKVPRTVEIAKDALAANKCVVIGLQTTGEARLKDALKSGCDLEEFAGMKETVKCARWKQIFRRPPTLPIPPQPLPPLSHAIAPLPSRTFPTCLCEPPACVHRFLLGKFPTGDYLGMHTEDDSDAEGESDEDDDMGRVNHSTAARNAKSKASGRRGEVVSDDDDDDDDMAGFIVNSDDEEYAEVLSCATATAQSLATQRLPIETSRARSAVSQRLTPPPPTPSAWDRTRSTSSMAMRRVRSGCPRRSGSSRRGSCARCCGWRRCQISSAPAGFVLGVGLAALVRSPPMGLPSHGLDTTPLSALHWMWR